MSSWKTHIVLNFFILFIWIMFLFNYNFIDNYFLLILLILFSSFLSIFPDIDTWKSKIRDFFSFLFASILTVYFFFNLFKFAQIYPNLLWHFNCSFLYVPNLLFTKKHCIKKHYMKNTSHSNLVLAIVILSILGLSQIALAAQIRFAWDPNTESDLAGYKIYYGTTSGTFKKLHPVPNKTLGHCWIQINRNN